jgi:UDP:flavonoid glycosyltransferase YjiC (YdhE family)
MLILDTGDGRIDVDVDSRLSRTLSKLVKVPLSPDHPAPSPPQYSRYATPDQFPLKMNIVIQVVGSRGDVQPFVALGNGLQKYGHRVRLATHAKFEAFVHDAGLEFYPIGGDPEDLMSYMVRNPGLMPSMRSLRAGDISRKRTMIAEMLEGCWNSCITADPLTNEPFVADAIIANPPSFAHMHCAEALCIPLHLMFTMPWSATTAFPHPLANLSNGTMNPKHANYISYILVEVMTWQGLGDVINAWRRRIGLEPVPVTEGPMLASTLSVPYTYCWSPALVPKPQDWPAHIDVSGFFFRGTFDYNPPNDLKDFLDAGPRPVYIGFGSIVLDSAVEMSVLILDAITACGLRAIVSRGWSRLDGPERPDVFWLEDCPHEWLFQHVSAVVHHGGAGTTACGLRNARPTFVVPFFGDQPFWGDMVAAAGSGPKPIPHKLLNANNLADALRFCHEDAAQSAATEIARKMKEEDGVQTAVLSSLNRLPVDKMQCDLLPDQAACWGLKVNKRMLKISRLAAEILARYEGLNPKNLKV